MDPFVRLDATEQGQLVRKGEVSAVELVEAAIRRIEALDPELNAVTARCFERALDEAKAPRKGPFMGVPFLVKDLAALDGAPLTFGSRFFADLTVGRSEPSVDACLAAGLIPLGKSNTPEFGLLPSTESMLLGDCRNPWDLARSAGGSSGGAAVAVASGMVPIAGGGDGGGSIRIPASCCGVFGFKPSRDRVVAPKRMPPGALSVHLGLTRTVRDAAQLFAASERRDAGAPTRIGRVTEPDPTRLRIAVSTRAVNGAAPEPEVAAALSDVARLCRMLGHQVEEAEPSFDREAAIDHFLAYWSAVPRMILRNLPLLRLRFWNWSRPEESFEPWFLSLDAWHRRQRRERGDIIAQADAFFAEASKSFDTFFERYDVVLSPVLRRPPALLGEMPADMPFEELLPKVVDYVGYTPLYNVLGGPAMSIPLSFTAAGLPIGAHFGAASGDDARLFALALELEAARPWAHLWPPVSAATRQAQL